VLLEQLQIKASMSRGKLIDASFAFAAGAIFILSAIFSMDESGALMVKGSAVGWSCPFKLIFSYPCPFCGLSRSFVAMGHGDFSDSLQYHPLGWLMFFGFIVTFISIIWSFISKSSPVCERNVFIYGCLSMALLFISFWLIRIFIT